MTYLKASDLETVGLPFKDLYILQKEVIDAHSHFVMFRRGEDDDSYGPVVIPPDRLFVLGDNRDSSDDSRYWGMVPMDNLEGKAVFIWASFDWEKRVSGMRFPPLRLERIMTVIH